MSTLHVLAAASVLCLLTGIGFGLLFRKISARSKPSVPQPSAEFIADRYRPLERLLDPREFAFLARAGLCRAQVRRFRAQRRGIARLYVAALVGDFQGSCRELRGVLLQSAEDRPDLAAILLRQEMLFLFRRIQLQIAFLLHAWGVECVSFKNLLRPLELLRSEVSLISESGSELAA